eukprot:gene23903-9470_t
MSLQPLSPGPANGEATFKYWLGGLLKHAPALTAMCAPTPNCYRRLHVIWGPSHGNWGFENRSQMVRVKHDGPGSDSSYFENRLGCSASNPYLVLAANVAAGLDGLRNKIEPPPGDGIEGCLELPKSLPEAIHALEADVYMAEAMGAGLINWFRLVKETEMERVAGSNNEERLEKERQMYLHLL